ncbi:unnamed protein product [Menidia menidia]|uniref:Large ribosomal subunit protein bL34m n=1 Tax=Menidia menidia TaxID=238744 RepID=A0A8S4AY40_9TELE|nr:unnamed protein product [Menidia menidia]
MVYFGVNLNLVAYLKMNVILSYFTRLRSIPQLSGRIPTMSGTCSLRTLSNWNVFSKARPLISRNPSPLSSQAEGSEIFQQYPWQYQQVRTRKRGTEYQPKNIKRKRTHGWIKRLSSQGGIEVLLRRILKGRKSLSH